MAANFLNPMRLAYYRFTPAGFPYDLTGQALFNPKMGSGPFIFTMVPTNQPLSHAVIATLKLMSGLPKDAEAYAEKWLNQYAPKKHNNASETLRYRRLSCKKRHNKDLSKVHSGKIQVPTPKQYTGGYNSNSESEDEFGNVQRKSKKSRAAAPKKTLLAPLEDLEPDADEVALDEELKKSKAEWEQKEKTLMERSKRLKANRAAQHKIIIEAAGVKATAEAA